MKPGVNGVKAEHIVQTWNHSFQHVEAAAGRRRDECLRLQGSGSPQRTPQQQQEAAAAGTTGSLRDTELKTKVEFASIF